MNNLKIIMLYNYNKKGHTKTICWGIQNIYCGNIPTGFSGSKTPKLLFIFFSLTNICLPSSRVHLTYNFIFSSLIYRIKSSEGSC